MQGSWQEKDDKAKSHIPLPRREENGAITFEVLMANDFLKPMNDRFKKSDKTITE